MSNMAQRELVLSGLRAATPCQGGRDGPSRWYVYRQMDWGCALTGHDTSHRVGLTTKQRRGAPEPSGLAKDKLEMTGAEKKFQ